MAKLVLWVAILVAVDASFQARLLVSLNENADFAADMQKERDLTESVVCGAGESASEYFFAVDIVLQISDQSTINSCSNTEIDEVSAVIENAIASIDLNGQQWG